MFWLDLALLRINRVSYDVSRCSVPCLSCMDREFAWRLSSNGLASWMLLVCDVSLSVHFFSFFFTATA